MVLCLKTWESRSSPGLQRTDARHQTTEDGRQISASAVHVLPLHKIKRAPQTGRRAREISRSIERRPRSGPIRPPSSALRPPFVAGWSSPVARQAHNLKAAGSNPAPATTVACRPPGPKPGGFFRWSTPISPQARPPARSPAPRPPARAGSPGSSSAVSRRPPRAVPPC